MPCSSFFRTKKPGEPCRIAETRTRAQSQTSSIACARTGMLRAAETDRIWLFVARARGQQRRPDRHVCINIFLFIFFFLRNRTCTTRVVVFKETDRRVGEKKPCVVFLLILLLLNPSARVIGRRRRVPICTSARRTAMYGQTPVLGRLTSARNNNDLTAQRTDIRSP
uniref:Uncharacterized protein n=1 Tax=Sipha flava TaxID=143950 RepID=A0A2S2QRW5_9HEMI